MKRFFTLNNTEDITFAEPFSNENPPEGSIWIIPLGGLGEIGKNMMLLESKDDILIVDSGIMFPSEEMLGIDYVIPDIRYLLLKKEKLRAIIITHGHEDHIGAIPYLIGNFDNLPIYGTKLTLEILRAKLKEFELHGSYSLCPVKAGDEITQGAFSVSFFDVIHSISESVGLIISTPAGRIVHSGDFKMQKGSRNMKDGLSSFLENGNKPVRLLMSDSTYADRPGFSRPEELVGKTLDRVFGKCGGRIIISTFASSIPRIEQIASLAEKHGRKLCVHGRGLESILSIARDLGYFNLSAAKMVKIEEVKKLKDEEVLILATGSQGEPLSALTLMATNSHKWIKIKDGDTVIISATPVPGNETLVHNTINSLFRLGAEVIYEVAFKSENSKKDEFHIHVSGHGSREELKLMIQDTNPEFFVPIHGEFRHLVHHGRLAQEMGITQERIFQIDDGTVLELSEEELRVIGRIHLENVYVDGLGIGDVGRSVLKDRQTMSDDGICFIVAVIDSSNSEIISGPHIETRGLIYVRESQELLDEAQNVVRKALVEAMACSDNEEICARAKLALRKLFTSRIKRRPLIVPLILEI